jgi:hypothetical protein
MRCSVHGLWINVGFAITLYRKLWTESASKMPDRIRRIEDIAEPYPLKRRVPLTQSHPEIASQWHHRLNRWWGPDEFIKVWWQCESKNDHIWAAIICNRTMAHTGCPHCCFESYGIDLRQYPKVLRFFDKKRNPDVDPHKVSIGRGVWWRCTLASDHTWYSRFNINVVDEFCPYCRGRSASKTNSLALYPEIAGELHPTKNGKVRAEDLVPGSRLYLWFQCAKVRDHVFQPVHAIGYSKATAVRIAAGTGSRSVIPFQLSTPKSQNSGIRP